MSAFQPYNPADKGNAFNQQVDVYSFESIGDSSIQAEQDDTSLLIEATRKSLSQNREARHD
jgi:hypothetical protein